MAKNEGRKGRKGGRAEGRRSAMNEWSNGAVAERVEP